MIYIKVTGIVCEYNPFHNGHSFHIRQTRNLCGSDYIIGVMSGCFTQRGTPAVTDKYTRTRMALLSGCDMIIELPVRYATSSAEGFSSAAIETLKHSGITDSVCFGSEQGNLENLKLIARILKEEPEEYRKDLLDEMRKGSSYPAAREYALNTYIKGISPAHSDYAFEYKPNNILALEYIKACLDNTIIPYTIKRTDEGYHNLQLTKVCSAAAIRHQLTISDNTASIKDYVPDATLKLLKTYVTHEDFSLVLYAALSARINELELYNDMSKGLASRIRKNLCQYNGWNTFIQLIKSRQYTYTRVQRALLHCMLGIKSSAHSDTFAYSKYHVPYIRVLGFKKEASVLMKSLNESADVPVITRPARASEVLDDFGIQLINEDISASELYRQVVLHKYNTNNTANEYTNGLIII